MKCFVAFSHLLRELLAKNGGPLPFAPFVTTASVNGSSQMRQPKKEYDLSYDGLCRFKAQLEIITVQYTYFGCVDDFYISLLANIVRIIDSS